MKVQYIGHSGFLVTMESCCLLFDYYMGTMPEISEDRFSGNRGFEDRLSESRGFEDRLSENSFCENSFSGGRPLYIFSSHRHQDHFNPDIFSFSEMADRVEYLLSCDIKLNDYFFRKYPQAVKLRDQGRLHSLRADEKYVIDNLEIDTIKSTDEGVAFLVSVPREQKRIYHAGDLNWWIWPEDTKQEYHNMTAMFQRSVGRLTELVQSGGAVDAAFLPLDPRQEQYEFCGMEYYLDRVPAKHVFPMHCWEQYEIIPRFLDAHRGQYPEAVIHMITERGECYEI